MRFVGRKRELQSLESFYRSPEAGLLILYGRRILTDLMKRSQRMPQVAEGWQTQYALFAREGFTEVLQQHAKSLDALLISLTQIESTLLEV